MTSERPVAGVPAQADIEDQPPAASGGRRRALLLVGIAIVAGAAIWGWRVYVARTTPDGVVVLSGRIEGDDSTVAPKTGGRIVEVRVREGDHVNQGDAIAILDDDQVRAREDQARAVLTQAEARFKSARDRRAVLDEQLRQAQLQVEQTKADATGRLRQAEADMAAAEAQLAQQEASYQLAVFDKEAYTRLAQTGAASDRQGKQAAWAAEQQAAVVTAAKRRVDAAQAALTNARANLATSPDIRIAEVAAIRQQIAQQDAEVSSATAQTEQVRAQLAEAQANRHDLIVRAPFSGTVITRAAEPGEVVMSGTAIVTLVDLGTVYLRGFVPEGRIGTVKVGQPARVYLDSAPNQPVDAYVSRIDPQATFTPENTYFRDDRVKQVVGVKLQLKGATGFAKPGMPADGEILVAGGRVAEGRPPIVSAIRLQDLRKQYGTVQAVRGLTFDTKPGEIFGLIGPDGAGKTSTFQILAGVMEATSGTAEVFGRPAREMRAHTGYLTQTFSLYPDLTVRENLRYIGDLRLVPPAEIERRSGRYLEMFDMDRFTERLAGKLSGGMKQKLALVCALVPEPQVLLLDEPTTGVDPVSRREFWDALAHLAADGLTILVATPYLDEAERCHRVALIYEGLIQQIGTPSELRGSLGATRLEVRTTGLATAEQLLSAMIPSTPDLIDVQRFGDRLDVLVREPQHAEALVRERLGRAGLYVDEVRVDTPLLENTFVARLRTLGHEVRFPAFPGRHDHRDLQGSIAIGGSHLTREFGSFKAVKNVSLDVRYGEVYGLLGANGAGKTTTIKMLCGLLEPTRGTIQLAGESRRFRSSEVRQRIGYMSQKFSLYEDLPIAENLAFFGGVYGVPAHELDEKMRWVLAFAGLEGKENQLVGSLPGGWKQRVAFGAAIMHEPSVLFLDEPTSGVDPVARRAFWGLINRLADAGTAILVTTHYLEEAEQCNRLGLMVAGELVAEDTPSHIKSRQRGHLLEIVVDQPQRATDRLKTMIDRWRVSLFGDRLHVITDEDVEHGLATVRAALAAGGISVLQGREVRFSLEDVFISVVEQARQQGKVAVED